jgi:drug/metabolite transporter (DMT)-like permease
LDFGSTQLNEWPNQQTKRSTAHPKSSMPLTAIGLLFGSAILHTSWNLLLKQAGEKYMATWWAMLIGSLLFLPALAFLGLPARSTWLLLCISAFVEAGYFVVLSYAYDDADFSLVYPIGRGAAPALIAVWSILFLGETLTAGGIAGLVVIIAGLLIVGSSCLFQADGRRHLGGIWLALLLALTISIYSVIDGAAVKRTGPLSYAALIYFVSCAYSTPFVLRRHGWQKLKAELATYHWRLAVTGMLIVVAYLMALWAYRLSSVSYSGAIREVNVVIGAIAGWQLLGEKFGPIRVLGSIVIFAGIVVIAVLG